MLFMFRNYCICSGELKIESPDVFSYFFMNMKHGAFPFLSRFGEMFGFVPTLISYVTMHCAFKTEGKDRGCVCDVVCFSQVV